MSDDDDSMLPSEEEEEEEYDEEEEEVVDDYGEEESVEGSASSGLEEEDEVEAEVWEEGEVSPVADAAAAAATEDSTSDEEEEKPDTDALFEDDAPARSTVGGKGPPRMNSSGMMQPPTRPAMGGKKPREHPTVGNKGPPAHPKLSGKRPPGARPKPKAKANGKAKGKAAPKKGNATLTPELQEIIALPHKPIGFFIINVALNGEDKPKMIRAVFLRREGLFAKDYDDPITSVMDWDGIDRDDLAVYVRPPDFYDACGIEDASKASRGLSHGPFTRTARRMADMGMGRSSGTMVLPPKCLLTLIPHDEYLSEVPKKIISAVVAAFDDHNCYEECNRTRFQEVGPPPERRASPKAKTGGSKGGAKPKSGAKAAKKSKKDKKHKKHKNKHAASNGASAAADDSSEEEGGSGVAQPSPLKRARFASDVALIMHSVGESLVRAALELEATRED